MLGPSRGELARIALSRKFDLLYQNAFADFRTFVVTNPMLGAEHPFGKLLAAAVRRSRKTKLEPHCWFTATKDTTGTVLAPRTRERANTVNRFNQFGQVAWYFGDDEKAAAVEVLREPVAGKQFAISKAEMLTSVRVLDLRTPIHGHPSPGQSKLTWILREVIKRRAVSEPTDESDASRPQYRVPQYVADAARGAGFQGIIYDSTRPSAYNNPEAWGTNLVLFDPPPSAFRLSAVELKEFAEPDRNIFSSERWQIKPIDSCCEGAR